MALMFEPITPVPAEPPTTGLVASARTPSDNARWQNGIAWRSERCPNAAGFDPCASTFESPAGSGGDDLNYYRPVAFRVIDVCSTRNRAYDPQRVVRQATAVTSWMVARELEQATISRANPYVSPDSEGDPLAVNAYLAQAIGSQIVSGGPFTPLAGLGALEEAARDGQLGMDPFIHVAPKLIPLFENALERNGSILRTKTGAIVVADAGYTATGPFTAGTAEVQTVTVTGTPTGGTFTLTFTRNAVPATTAPIAYNATAAALEAALEALPNLETGDVAVGGGPGPGTPWTVTFAAHLGNVALMTDNDSGLTGGTTPAVTVTTTTPGVNPAPTAGTWMYATGPVTVRLDPVVALQDMIWANNEQSYIAQRLFAATFDPCTLRAVNITVPAPA
jgi:hypothetical protein